MTSVMYSQLHPWSSAGAEPCMEKISGCPVPIRIGSYYHTPRPHPWRPTLAYESISPNPMPGVNMTAPLMDSGYMKNSPAGEPLRYPNLVTGFHRNPGHAARTALYTRYTPYEWGQSNITQYTESDTVRSLGERLRANAFRVMRDTDEKTSQGQREAGQRLGEKITDTTYWRNEISTELERLIAENNLLLDTKRALEKALQDSEGPLHIAQECLYHREGRQGIDLVHDQPEQTLLQEVENIRNLQDRMNKLLCRMNDQLASIRAARYELESDLNNKEQALGIDHTAHQLNNYSRNINYFGGIEKVDPTVSIPETWAEFSHRNIQRSQSERAGSQRLRTETDNLLATGSSDIWASWNSTNNSLAQRAAETLDAKSRLQMHLHKVQQEIFDIEKNIELLRKSIQDKSAPLKVAQTRLESRTHRPDIELCRDNPQHRLVREVRELEQSVEQLHRKLQEAEVQHQQLLKTRANLEHDLRIKSNSLYIDREKCLGMRKSFPVTTIIKY